MASQACLSLRPILTDLSSAARDRSTRVGADPVPALRLCGTCTPGQASIFSCKRFTDQPLPRRHGFLLHKSRGPQSGLLSCASADGFGAQPDTSSQDRQGVPSEAERAPVLEVWLERLPVRQRVVFLAGGFLCLAAIAWLRNLAAAGLVDDTEPLFVEAARQMLLTGEWTTPQFNAQPRFDKPVLIYWLAALSARVFGRDRVWAYRLPSAICASLLMWGLVKSVRQFGLPYLSNRNTTVTAYEGSLISCIATACAFAMSTEAVVWGSIGVSDMLLTATTGGCLLSFFYGYVGAQHGSFKWGYPLSAFFMALSVLSKGPVGVVVPSLVCFVFLLYTGELLRVIKELPLVKGASVVLGLNLPWYLTMVLKHGRMYTSTFFGYHNLERFTKGVNHHDGRPFWFPSAVVLGAHLPWSLAVPLALLRSRLLSHRSIWRTTPRDQRLVPFAAAWFLAVFGFFSLSASQLPSYYLPLSPAVALLAASLLTRDEREKRNERSEQGPPAVDIDKLTSASTLVAYVLQAVAISQLPLMLATSGDAKAIEIGLAIAAERLHWTGTAIYSAAALAVTRTHEFSKLHTPSKSAKTIPSSQPSRMRLPLWAVQAATGGIFLAAFFSPTYALFDHVRQRPLRQLAVMAASCQRRGEPLCMVGPKMPSVVFYAQRPVAFFDTMKQAAFALAHEAKTGVSSALLLGDAADFEASDLEESELAANGGYLLKRMTIPQ